MTDAYAQERTYEQQEARIRRFRGWWFALMYVLAWALTYATAYNVGYRHGHDAALAKPTAEKPQ